MDQPSESASWQIGEWLADPRDDSLTRDGTSVRIEPRLMQLLICLASASPQVVSIDRLLGEVWSGVVVGSASVYQSISQLRKLLGDTESTPRYIETVARKGYRVIAPVKRLVHQNVPAGFASAGALADTALGPAPGSIPVSMPASIPGAVALVDGARAEAFAGAVEARAGAPVGSRKLWLTSALAAIVLIIVAIALRHSASPPAPDNDSIAVLPFVDLSTAQNEAPFCDGLTEELSSWLAQLPALNVVARTSAFAFRGKVEDVREIGRRLGTTHLLEGSVRRNGDALRVTVKLVATKSGYEIWTESYDAPNDDVLTVQEQIARAVAANLEVRLTQDTLRQFDARRSTSPQAHRLYLIARHHQQRLTQDDNSQAIDLFRKVIDQDPGFALAYVGLAKAYLNQRYYIDRPIAEIAANVEPLLDKARELQPNLAEIYATQGALNTELLRPADALRDLERAVQLDSNSREALSELGFLHLTSGEPRSAVTDYTRAGVLDPLSGGLQAQRCMAMQDLAQFDQAAIVCERARALEPRSAWAYTASAWLEEARGQLDEALKWNLQSLERSPDTVENLAQRGLWLLVIGLPQRAAQAHQRATSAQAGNSGYNPQLLELGFLIALETGGVPALRTQLRSTPIDANAPPQMLFQLAEAALMADDPAEARRFVDRALAQPALDAATLNSPWLARTGESYQLIAAMAKQRTNDAAGAEKHLAELSALLDRLTASGMRRHGVATLRAKVAALRGNADEAMRSLQTAASLGWYGVWRVEHEPYLASLSNRADYRDLVTRVTQSNAEMRARVPND